ncbi:phage late control D family protein [Tissierella praeacuta]|uniref:phage late control D family protein n=1 Tax=Tissierella praeacuta TaxID=43131 RepID=UPI0028A7F282|nr:hypothetical protein [Tissierella praeacuta]
MLARRTEVYIEYENKDISADIKPYLLDFSYQDNEDEADDLQITLEDKAGLWQKDWFPEKYAKIKAEIFTINYEYEGQRLRLPCGKFEIDDIGSSGPPNTVKLKAISIPASNSVNHETRTKAWEKVSFKNIASGIASANGMGIMIDIANDKFYDRVDQNQESDLAFLKRLCKSLGFVIKVVNLDIVIFEDKKYQDKTTVRTITKGEPSLISFDFNENSLSAYKAAKVSYKDPETGDLEEATVNNEIEQKSGKTLQINKRVKNKGEAEELGKKSLGKENKKTRTAKFTLAGDLKLVSKQTIGVEGWGKFDGKYMINNATHKIGTSGYTVDIDCSKV